jgi:phosphoserine phosphatase RsbU/P
MVSLSSSPASKRNLPSPGMTRATQRIPTLGVALAHARNPIMFASTSRDQNPTTASPGVAIQIRCAEIWGGVSAREAEFTTPGVHAAMHSSASGDQKGGDVYYFSVCGYDAITRIALADVRGHGHAVSHISEWLYQALASHMNDRNGAAVLTELNEITCRRGFEAITTAAIATFHRDDRRLFFAYAGHPPMMIHQPAAAGAWKPLLHGGAIHVNPGGPANLPLGMFAKVEYSQYEVEIEPGDRICIYSDGVSECPSANAAADAELYGDGPLLAALQRTGHLPVKQARDAIREDLHAFAGVNPLTHDDCTFLLVEPLSPAPFWKRRLIPRKLQRPPMHHHGKTR